MAIAWIARQTDSQLIKTFQTARWEVKTFTPVDSMLYSSLSCSSVDIIVIKAMDRSSLEICLEICRQQIAPVLAIVSDLAYAQAAVEGGAEDFLVTPVEPIEALLRVRKLARTTEKVRVGDIEVDLAAWRVTSCGQRIHLSTIEFRLLAVLARRVGQMVGHATILEEVWMYASEQKTSALVSNYIGRLRRKIEPDLQKPQYIISIPGTGYRLRNQRQWESDRREAGTPNRLLKAPS
jgi:DNA-binding response OmpR family regulator